MVPIAAHARAEFNKFELGIVEKEGAAVLVQWKHDMGKVSWLSPPLFHEERVSKKRGKAIKEAFLKQRKKDSKKTKLEFVHMLSACCGFLDTDDMATVNGSSRSCMQDAAMIAALHVGVEIDKSLAYRQVPKTRVKDRPVADLLAASAFSQITFLKVGNVMTKKLGSERVLFHLPAGVYFACAHIEGKKVTNHAFVYVSGVPRCAEPGRFVGTLLDNRSCPSRHVEPKETAGHEKCRETLVDFFGGNCIVFVTRIWQIKKTDGLGATDIQRALKKRVNHEQ
jgi:hypothetical protein